jgi:hypothetical protein
MEAPGTNEEIWDWTVTTRGSKGKPNVDSAYGPFWTKVLARYDSATNPFGTFSSTNANSYAQFALARYARTKLGE